MNRIYQLEKKLGPIALSPLIPLLLVIMHYQQKNNIYDKIYKYYLYNIFTYDENDDSDGENNDGENNDNKFRLIIILMIFFNGSISIINLMYQKYLLINNQR